MRSERFRGGLVLNEPESPALSLPILELPTTLASEDHSPIEHLLGLGGAGFSLSKKIASGENRSIDTLIINAAECEPQMACDQALIREEAADIIRGIEQLLHHTGVMRAIIGVESHRHIEIDLLRQASQLKNGISIRTIEPRYPTGSEALLIKVLTGRQVPAQGLPRDCGVLCFNIATAHAFGLWKLKGTTQTSRVVTVTGTAIETPRNVRVTFGTPIATVISAVAPTLRPPLMEHYSITVGGPMTGRAMHAEDATISAKTNCLIVDHHTATLETRPCIRCGDCNTVCPVNLLPQQLHWYAREHESDLDNLQRFNLEQCIECGCCDVVCPSHIPLTQQFRQAKASAQEARFKKRRATIAAQRFDARELRLARREKEKAARIAARKAELGKARQSTSQHNAIQDAIVRAKASRPKRQSTAASASGAARQRPTRVKRPPGDVT